MTWVSHAALTGTIAYAVSSDPLAAAAACVGAVLPDKVEGSPGSVGWRTWRSRHRGWSHWPMLYLALIGALLHSETYIGSRMFLTLLLWVFLGALLHIAEDAVCGKVPAVLPTQKIGIRLFTVGSLWEYLFTAVCIGIVYAGSCFLANQ